MKKLIIDMDEVITCNNFESLIGEYLGYEYDFSNHTSYRMQDVLGDKKRDFFLWFKDQNYYKNGTLLEGCYEVIKELNEIYEVYIVTDFFWPEPEIHSSLGKFVNDKYNFLYKELDFLKPNQFVFCCNKKLIKADIKIDDKITNLTGAKTKLMYTAYHNKQLTDDELAKKKVTRVNNWQDIKKILIK